jgi:CO dehydrogenase nickel-insertion accessory protein CooC1
MDFSFNLGAEFPARSLPARFLGSNSTLIKHHVGLNDEATFAESLRAAQEKNITFRTTPPDPFTDVISEEIAPGLRTIVVGPHTDFVRSGARCSHSLAAPLKVYLPRLERARDEIVILDERAGCDPVATGILSSMALAVIVVEPTVHSVRVAHQIAHELALQNVPFAFAANKANSDNAVFNDLPKRPMISIPFSQTPDTEHAMRTLLDNVSAL